MGNQDQDTTVSANSMIARVSEDTATSSSRSQDDHTVASNGRRKGESWRYPWDDSESALVMGLQAQKMLSWHQIRENFFPTWSTAGLWRKCGMLKEVPRWKALYDKLLQMEVSEQVAFIDRAKSAVARYRSARGQEQGQEKVDEVIEDEFPRTEPLAAALIGRDRKEEAFLATTEPLVKKTWSNGRQSKFERHPWDENESELLVALRARGLSYHKLLKHDFASWSMAISHKMAKLRATERWEARFQAILRMNETKQLATIASAQAAVARSRRRRARAVQEVPDGADAANNATAHETATTQFCKRAPTGAAGVAAVDESTGPDRKKDDAREIPETPDHEMSRTAPTALQGEMSLGGSEDDSNNSSQSKDGDEVSSSSSNISRPGRSQRLPARYRDKELQQQKSSRRHSRTLVGDGGSQQRSFPAGKYTLAED